GVIGGPALDSFQIAFFRCLFGLLALMPWIIQGGGFAVFKTDRLGLQLIRAIVGVGAMTSFFYALARAPLADVTAISFAKPLFVVLLAVFFLSEKVRWRRWTATAVGFLGVVIMLRPGQDGFDPVLLVALMGSFLVACAVIFVKKMTKTETTLTMLAYFGIISSLVTLIPALLVWRDPTLTQWGMLLVIGSLGVLSQSFIIRAFRCGEASAVAPFDYTRLIFAAVFGFFLFAEIPDIWTLGGASIIVAATFYIARREASLGKPAKGPAEAITRKV
ncbi:MAG: DMT family transporter, partial [Pseudomonadota bacterium]